MSSETLEYDSRPRRSSLFVSGNVKEIWRIAYPLMLNSMSVSVMMFTDRLILSHFSSGAMNAAAAAFSIFWSFQFALYALASVTEIFVGQYNGARQYSDIGRIVWQMIWFSLMTAFIFYPIGIFGGKYLIPNVFHEVGVPYFKWAMLFGPAFIVVGPLSDFFIVRGRTKFVTLTILLGIVLNIVLNIVLVFGVKGLIPSFGTNGAAIATGISQIFQALLLFAFFLSARNRKKYGTNRFAFHKKTFLECIKMGWPVSVSHLSTSVAATIFALIVSRVEPAYITALTIAQSVYYLVCFIPEGIGKAVCVFASNLIGNRNYNGIPKVLFFAFKLHVIFAIILAIPMVIFSDLTISLFMEKNTTGLSHTEFIEIGRMAMRWMWAYCFFDGVCWNLFDVLNASGDTKFLMWMNMASSWIFQTLPAFICICLLKSCPSLCWKLMVLDMTMSSLFCWFRYRKGKWRHIALTPDLAEVMPISITERQIIKSVA